MRYQGVLFDFDGVLLDSLAVHLQGWKYSARLLKEVELSDEDARKYAGMSTRSIGQALANFLGMPHQAEQLIAEKIEFVRKHEAMLFPGAKEAVELAKKHTRHVAIVSNAPTEFIERNLAFHKIEGLKVFGLEDHPQPKPHPSAYINAAQILGVELRDFPNVIVLEDSKHGLLAGIHANMHGVGICTHNSAAELMSVGAKATFDSALEAMQNLLTSI